MQNGRIMKPSYLGSSSEQSIVRLFQDRRQASCATNEFLVARLRMRLTSTRRLCIWRFSQSWCLSRFWWSDTRSSMSFRTRARFWGLCATVLAVASVFAWCDRRSWPARGPAGAGGLGTWMPSIGWVKLWKVTLYSCSGCLAGSGYMASYDISTSGRKTTWLHVEAW